MKEAQKVIYDIIPNLLTILKHPFLLQKNDFVFYGTYKLGGNYTPMDTYSVCV